MGYSANDGGGARLRKFFKSVTADLVRGVWILQRYYTRDHEGQTRAERNALVDEPVPYQDIPTAGLRVWRLFVEHVCPLRVEHQRTKPSDLCDLLRLMRARLFGWEIDALLQMDAMWVKTTMEEVQVNRARMESQRPQRGGMGEEIFD